MFWKRSQSPAPCAVNLSWQEEEVGLSNAAAQIWGPPSLFPPVLTQQRGDSVNPIRIQNQPNAVSSRHCHCPGEPLRGQQLGELQKGVGHLYGKCPKGALLMTTTSLAGILSRMLQDMSRSLAIRDQAETSLEVDCPTPATTGF